MASTWHTEDVTVSTGSASTPERPSRFAANLDAVSDQRFSRLVRAAGEQLGRLPSYRGRREAERVDILRALLAVADRDEHVRAAVIDQVRTDRLERYGKDDQQ